jgi:hypothetical protein
MNSVKGLLLSHVPRKDFFFSLQYPLKESFFSLGKIKMEGEEEGGSLKVKRSTEAQKGGG